MVHAPQYGQLLCRGLFQPLAEWLRREREFRANPTLIQGGANHFDIIDTGLFYWLQTLSEMEKLLANYGGDN